MNSTQPVNRLGLVLFISYLALYSGFVFLTAFWPDTMSTFAIGTINLAVVYGFGLIFAAFILALIYGLFAKVHVADKTDKPEPPENRASSDTASPGGRS